MLELIIQLVLIDDDHHNSQLFILVALHDNFLLFPPIFTHLLWPKSFLGSFRTSSYTFIHFIFNNFAEKHFESSQMI